MNAKHPTRDWSRRGGIALVLVVLVMTLAGILAYAMLSAAAVQATASANASAAAAARAQAESGIHLAMYYLLNPANAPASFSPPCTVTATFATTQPAATIPGSVSIQVGAPSNHCYSVVSTGSSDSSAGVKPVTRTITAEIQVGSPFQINAAGGFYGGITVGANASFSSSTTSAAAIAASGVVTNNGHISGNVNATSVTAGGTWTNGSLLAASPTPAPASAANVTNYALPYVYQGTVGYPVLISSPISSITTLGPTPTNPLGIYYTTSSLSVTKKLTINGTLVVGGTGNLTNTSSIAITPVASQANTYLPALVVNSKLTMSGSSASLNVTGVAYVASGLFGLATNSATNVTINGALLVTANSVDSSFKGTMAVTYNPAYTNIPNFDVNNNDWASNSGVKIIAWSE